MPLLPSTSGYQPLPPCNIVSNNGTHDGVHQNFSGAKIQKFFFQKFFTQKNQPFLHAQIFIIKHTNIMDIQQHIYNNTGVLLPISGGNGKSISKAVVFDSKAKYRLVQVENEVISAMQEG